MISGLLFAAAVFQPFIGHSVRFQPGTVTLDAELSDVDAIAAWLAEFPETTKVQIAGYYCQEDRLPNSTDDDLLALSEQRAAKLKEQLTERGLDGERIATIAQGTLPGTASCQATAFPAFEAAPALAPIVGIGLALARVDGAIVVDELLADAPAQADGTIQVGDRIVAVKTSEDAEWAQVAELNLRKLVHLIRGIEHTVVGLEIERVGVEGRREVFLTRETLKLRYLEN